MDPQSVAFTPQSEVSRLSDAMRSFQQTQQEHAERLIRLERRQDEDARVKSVWGPSSPFAGVLGGSGGGTPQQGPLLQTSSHDDFTNFDEDASNNMVRSLHLDADDEPRPLASTSRANSVRFDSSAKPGQWPPGSRSSIDYISRTSSGLGGLGGHPLFERTTSHKSEGRQSSAGHSASRANSLGLDTSQPFGQSPTDPPGLAPGLFILGSVPAIIRCWLNTNFKHDTLLYAAVCTGSHKSFLDIQLIENLGFYGQIRQDISGTRKIKLPVYLPEAVPHLSSSRSSSPAPQLPCLSVDFTVTGRDDKQSNPKAIQIFLGSDTLRAHNADVLFSSNSMTLFDDDRSKLSVPFVRPENDETFKSLYISSASLPSLRIPLSVAPGSSSSLFEQSRSVANGVPLSHQESRTKDSASEPDDQFLERRESGLSSAVSDFKAPISIASPGDIADSTEQPPRGQEQKLSVNPNNNSKPDTQEVNEENPQITASSRTHSSSGIWSNWRRDSSGAGDWASTSRGTSSHYQRPNRDQGMKVLKPAARQSSRSATTPSSQSPGPSQGSRFFDEGRRRPAAAPPNSTGDTHDANPQQQQQQLKRSMSSEPGKTASKDNSSGKGMKGVNPIGGASAFGWLNSGQK